MTTPTELFLDALKRHEYEPRKSGDGWTCRCPAHDDNSPSLSINTGDDGRALVHCFTGCSNTAVVEAVGLRLADLMPERTEGRWKPSKATRKPPPAPRTYENLDDAVAALERGRDRNGDLLGRHDHLWHYHDAAGDIIGAVVRWDLDDGIKEVRPASLTDAGWTLKGMPSPRPLYGLHKLTKLPEGARVFVLEGEKAADAAAACGLVATTSPHGCGGASTADWTSLRDMDVVILPDHDDAGEKYAEAVAKLLPEAGARTVKIVRLRDHWPYLPKGGDLADVLDASDADLDEIHDAVQALADAADLVSFPLHPQGGELPRNESEPRTLPWRAWRLSEMGPSNPPEWIWPNYVAKGTMTLFTALWKAGKSTLVRHLLQDLHRGGGLVPGPLDDLRVLVMSEETCDQWCRARDAFELDDDRVQIVRHNIHTRPNLKEWIELWVEPIFEKVTREGIELVVIDTISAFWSVKDENSAVEVGDALRPLRAFTDAGVAVLLIHHPPKSETTFDNAARGSGALSGFPDLLMTMGKLDGANDDDRRRVLKVKGRFDELPPETVIELTDDGYVVIGGRHDAKATDLAEIVVGILPAADTDGMTYEQVRDAWPTDGTRPGVTALRGLLNSTTGQWERTGKGVKNSPHRYRLTARDSFHGTPNPCTGKENESICPTFDTLTVETHA